MKDVYVLYGRIYPDEGIYDHDGNYFSESPVLEIFDTYESAYKQFEKYVIKAYNELKEIAPLLDLDYAFIEETTEADLFGYYNFYRGEKGMGLEEFMHERNKFIDSLPDMSVSWYFSKSDGEFASWQMEMAKISDDKEIPILPRLFIEKKSIMVK